jgi:hypothetical protein
VVGNAITELGRLRLQADDVREVLRSHGHQPNGKRLADAVDEALRHSGSCFRALLGDAAVGLRALQEQQAMPDDWADELISRCERATREQLAPVTVDPP